MPVSSTPPTRLSSRLAIAMLPVACLALGAGGVWISDADRPLFHAIQSITMTFPDALWAWVTDQAGVIAVAAWMSLTLLRLPRAAAAVLLSWPAGLVVIRGLKYLIDEARPQVVLPPEAIHVVGVELSSLSFPSGHTATAFAVAAALLYSLSPAHQRIAALPVLLIAALIGLSRIAVGAHWPVDVLAGAGLGWLCGLSGVWWSDRWRFWEHRRGVMMLAALGLLAGILRLSVDSGYPTARHFAALLGIAAMSASLLALWRTRRSDAC